MLFVCVYFHDCNDSMYNSLHIICQMVISFKCIFKCLAFKSTSNAQSFNFQCFRMRSINSCIWMFTINIQMPNVSLNAYQMLAYCKQIYSACTIHILNLEMIIYTIIRGTQMFTNTCANSNNKTCKNGTKIAWFLGNVVRPFMVHFSPCALAKF